MPTSSRSTARPAVPGGHQLADHADDEQPDGEADHGRPDHRLDVGGHADLHEEDGNQQVAHRTEFTLDARVLVAAADRQAGHEGTDDRGQARPVGRPGQRQHKGDSDDNDRRRRTRPALDGTHRCRSGEDSDDRGDDEKADRSGDRPGDRQGVDVATRHHRDDDGEDQQAEDIVSNGGAEHHPRFGRGRRAKVADTRGP